MTNRRWNYLTWTIAAAALLIFGARYLHARSDCERRGGVLTNGALWGFACVAPPTR